jgi:hypothetical protein
VHFRHVVSVFSDPFEQYPPDFVQIAVGSPASTLHFCTTSSRRSLQKFVPGVLIPPLIWYIISLRKAWGSPQIGLCRTELLSFLELDLPYPKSLAALEI